MVSTFQTVSAERFNQTAIYYWHIEDFVTSVIFKNNMSVWWNERLKTRLWEKSSRVKYPRPKSYFLYF